MNRKKGSYAGAGGRFSWLLAVLMVLPMMLASCGGSSSIQEGETLSANLQKSEVPAEKGSQFIAIYTTGSWTIDLSEDWATVSVKEGSGNTSSVVLSYGANTSTDSRILEIVISTQKNSTTLEMTQAGATSSGGNTGESGSSTATSTWLELPATDADDGYDFFTHYMTFENKQARNYSFYWDYDNLVAHWVAYPLVEGHIGDSGRSDFCLDPSLPEAYQPQLSFKGWVESSSYARGHQLPSADRTFSYDANVQTFYGTNMTPQLHAFNEGIWLSLENSVRSWAGKSDTLYVVTGCSVEGATSKATDNDGKKVTIPTGYYKAVLRYSKNSTLGYGGYMAAAFYFEHKQYSDTDYKACAMSVDDLENIINIDLFVNLPEAVGNDNADKIEAEDPTTINWWW